MTLYEPDHNHSHLAHFVHDDLWKRDQWLSMLKQVSLVLADVHNKHHVNMHSCCSCCCMPGYNRCSTALGEEIEIHRIQHIADAGHRKLDCKLAQMAWV